MPKLSHDDVPTSVAFGFLISVLQVSERFKSNKLVFCWDSGGKREQVYPQYKAARREALPGEVEERKQIHAQFEALRDEILPRMGFKNQLMQAGYESDDLIAAVVGSRPDLHFVIVSADHDLYQVLRHPNCIICPGPREPLVSRSSFFLKYGIKPGKWDVVKAIAGCDGDGVPGVPGVGETTAIKFINDELQINSTRWQAISRSIALIHRNHKLVYLPFPGCGPFTLQDDELSTEAFWTMFQDLGFESFTYTTEWKRWARLVKGEWKR